MKRCAKHLPQVCKEFIGYLSDKTLEWQSSYTGLRAFLVLPDLSQRYYSRPVLVGFVLAFLFSAGLLARTFPAASTRLIRTASSSLSIVLLLGRREGEASQKLFHGLGAVVELVHLLELPAQALVCLPS
jgi:hypothetical protein